MVPHGTTVATNAMLEGRGARVGLVTTGGYRQVLQIARSLVPGGLAAWITWPEPMADLQDTVEIEGRLTAYGEELRPLDKTEIRQKLEALRDRKVELLTISLINAYVNGAHERPVGEIAAEILGDVSVSLSHEVLPEMQKFERTLTTVANAAVRPVVGRYVRNLRARLKDSGMAGRIALLRSDVGQTSTEKAKEQSVNLLMSGPAGGVTGALWMVRHSGLKHITTLDVGGTSTDVALIENGEPRRVRATAVGALTVWASSLDVKTVGAGGDPGDPLEREAELVASKVGCGLVSAEGARHYGVVVDAAGTLDAAATDELRKTMRVERGALPVFNRGPSIEELRATCRAETGLDAPVQPSWERAARVAAE